jgi:uncharacterized BrkB/YihY/UPF0761 family membrane protein
VHHEIIGIYSVAWVFGAVGLLISVTYLVMTQRLRKRCEKVSPRWDGLYSGAAITLFLVILLCLVLSRHEAEATALSVGSVVAALLLTVGRSRLTPNEHR